MINRYVSTHLKFVVDYIQIHTVRFKIVVGVKENCFSGKKSSIFITIVMSEVSCIQSSYIMHLTLSV